MDGWMDAGCCGVREAAAHSLEGGEAEPLSRVGWCNGRRLPQAGSVASWCRDGNGEGLWALAVVILDININ